jgi:hypothetical protein
MWGAVGPAVALWGLRGYVCRDVTGSRCLPSTCWIRVIVLPQAACRSGRRATSAARGAATKVRTILPGSGGRAGPLSRLGRRRSAGSDGTPRTLQPRPTSSAGTAPAPGDRLGAGFGKWRVRAAESVLPVIVERPMAEHRAWYSQLASRSWAQCNISLTHCVHLLSSPLAI